MPPQPTTLGKLLLARLIRRPIPLTMVTTGR
jgi:hypothetical protein